MSSSSMHVSAALHFIAVTYLFVKQSDYITADPTDTLPCKPVSTVTNSSWTSFFPLLLTCHLKLVQSD